MSLGEWGYQATFILGLIIVPNVVFLLLDLFYDRPLTIAELGNRLKETWWMIADAIILLLQVLAVSMAVIVPPLVCFKAVTKLLLHFHCSFAAQGGLIAFVACSTLLWKVVKALSSVEE